jgi:hypothetical protein
VRRAEKELAEPPAKVAADWRDPVRDAVQGARRLRAEGKGKEADAILAGLKTLYHGDPAAEAILEGEQ